MSIDPSESFETQAQLAYEFCDGAFIDDAVIDQWWSVRVACDHGEWSGVSNGPIDLGRGLARALAKAREAHDA